MEATPVQDNSCVVGVMAQSSENITEVRGECFVNSFSPLDMLNRPRAM